MTNVKDLHILLMGIPVAVVQQGSGGRLRLTYTSDWQASDMAQSISLSLPYTQAEHRHARVFSYASGLLPENPEILKGWAAEFDVSAKNPFALLAHMGEDCAGAVQFVREERLEEVMSQPGDVELLSEKDLADALSRLRRNAPPWTETDGRKGMFSLAGVQAKIALAQTENGWCRPSGRAASTHILKPPANARFPGIEINEHVCLNIARNLGIPAAASRVERFCDEVALVVTRFDRAPDASTSLRRLHQEDTCQALGIPPTRKYQQDNGPGFRKMIELARAHSADPAADLQQILNAAAFNWIIGGTDAHAKNYSWYITAGDQIRMTPLYDLISSLPYYEIEELRLAMSIGGENRFTYMRRENWCRFAETLGADPEEVVSYIKEEVLDQIPVSLTKAIEAAAADGLNTTVLDRLQMEILKQAERCAATLG